jgi:hypothetical protein
VELLMSISSILETLLQETLVKASLVY